MIFSMTAFARNQAQGDWGSLTCELRSINHRFLEISCHLPEILRIFEMPIREVIRKAMKRGKIECSIRYQAQNATLGAPIVINESYVQALANASAQIANYFRSVAPIAVTDILRFPGVFETEPNALQILEPHIIELITLTTQDLLAARAREGEELNKLFLNRLSLMRTELDKVRAHIPQMVTDQQTRILKRFHEAKVELDPTRLEQEMVLFAQRVDISEELERALTHITEIERVLQQGGTIGRRIDFLLQELNREANTLGSKSIDPLITHTAVEAKVIIEQIREQVQNIE